MTDKQFEDLGYNDSPEHTDIIATMDREVTAILRDGSKRVIYRGESSPSDTGRWERLMAGFCFFINVFHLARKYKFTRRTAG